MLDHSKSPCAEDFLPIDDKTDIDTGRAYLVFIKMVHSKDYSTWLKMASCFGKCPCCLMALAVPLVMPLVVAQMVESYLANIQARYNDRE